MFNFISKKGGVNSPPFKIKKYKINYLVAPSNGFAPLNGFAPPNTSDAA